jgi:hypothetical protein
VLRIIDAASSAPQLQDLERHARCLERERRGRRLERRGRRLERRGKPQHLQSALRAGLWGVGPKQVAGLRRALVRVGRPLVRLLLHPQHPVLASLMRRLPKHALQQRLQLRAQDGC